MCVTASCCAKYYWCYYLPRDLGGLYLDLANLSHYSPSLLAYHFPFFSEVISPRLLFSLAFYRPSPFVHYISKSVFVFGLLLPYPVTSQYVIVRQTVMYVYKGLMNSSHDLPPQGWTSSPEGQGTHDSLVSSCITLVLCRWTVLCLNIFPASFGKCKPGHHKSLMADLTFTGPELTFQIAIGQWCSARRSVERFKRSGYPQADSRDQEWSVRHAFYTLISPRRNSGRLFPSMLSNSTILSSTNTYPTQMWPPRKSS